MSIQAEELFQVRRRIDTASQTANLRLLGATALVVVGASAFIGLALWKQSWESRRSDRNAHLLISAFDVSPPAGRINAEYENAIRQITEYLEAPGRDDLVREAIVAKRGELFSREMPVRSWALLMRASLRISLAHIRSSNDLTSYEAASRDIATAKRIGVASYMAPFMHYYAGSAAEGVGNDAKARDEFQRALEFHLPNDFRMPEFFEAMIANDLAWILATSPDDEVRDGTRAVEVALTIIPGGEFDRQRYELPPVDVSELHAIDTLAAAYAEAGDFDKAVSAQAVVVDLAEGVEAAALSEFKERLELYRSERPYRETVFRHSQQ